MCKYFLAVICAHTLKKKLKLRLKNTIIDKTLTYASETGIITRRERKSK